MANGGCAPPNVTISGLSVDEQDPLSVPRSRDLVVHGVLGEPYCDTPFPAVSWQLITYTANQSTLQQDQVLDLATNGTELKLPKRMYNYSDLYQVLFKVQMPDNGLQYKEARGFFKIVKSPIRAGILGGAAVTRQMNTIITLDGSSSRDPDIEPGHLSSMQFTWLCKIQWESFPTGPISTIPIVTPQSGPGAGGCFGTGVGKLDSNNVTVLLDLSYMYSLWLYHVKLIVEKDERQASTVQELNIVSGTTPEVTIQCVVNCKDRMDISTRLSLTSTCSGPGCIMATYQWQLLELISSGASLYPVTLTRDMTETDLNLPNIVLKRHQIPSYRTYRLMVVVTPQNGMAGRAAYQFGTNTPPSPGWCGVSSYSGVALKTQFSFSCSGWTDTDSPLTYKFQYRTGSVDIVLAYGHQQTFTTVLSPGTKVVEVMVIDSLSKAKTVTRTVQVQPIPVDEDIRALIMEKFSELQRELNLKKNMMAATRLANSMLETIDQSFNRTTTEDRIMIKDYLLEQMSNAEVNTLNSLTQVTSVIARATLVTSEVTFDKQASSIEALTRMTAILKDAATEFDGSESVTEVEQGAGNVLLAAVHLLSSAVNKIRNGTQLIQNKIALNSTLNLIDGVSEALMYRMVADQDPHQVHIDSMNMLFYRLSPKSFENQTDIPGVEAGFKVPFQALAGDKANDTLYIDSAVTLSGLNYYSWNTSSSLVNSHVLGLSFKNHRGETLTVQDSSEDIEITIPRERASQNGVSHYLKPNSEAKMQYHKLTVSSLPENGNLTLTMEPDQYSVFDIFVRYGYRPTVSTFDTKTKLPDESCTQLTYNSTDGCNARAYKLQLLDDVIGKPGTYFLGVQYERSSENTKRRRRDYEPTTHANYTMSVLQEQCLSWNSTEEQWTSHGCRVSFRSSPTSVHCLCNHLSPFGGSSLPIPIPLVSEPEDGCIPPEVTIANLPDDLASAVSILRSSSHMIKAIAGEPHCNTKVPQFQWTLYKLKWDNSLRFMADGNGTELEAPYNEWYLQKRRLAYGHYRVEVTATMPGDPEGLSIDKGYFNITKSTLIATIAGGSRITRGKGGVIYLNASPSRDPDVEPGDHSFMQFTWLCKNHQDSFPNSSLDTIPDVTAHSGPGTGGCFGTGVGKLNLSNMTVTLETSNMIVGEMYDVRLVMFKDDREAETVQEIEIVSGDPPRVSVSCVTNCNHAVNPSIRLSLTSTCTGHACNTAVYQWRLVTVNSNGDELSEISLTRDMTETELDLPGIIIKRDQLVGGMLYRMKVTATPDNGPVGSAAYQFRTNAPPHSGQCIVTPGSGEALKTNFAFNCTGWQDPEKPLTYYFSYKTAPGLYTVFAYGYEHHVTTVLPQGRDKTNNYTNDFEMRVIDSLSAATSDHISIQVQPPSADTDLTQVAVGNSSQIGQLIQSGNVHFATQLANAVLETVTLSNTTSTKDRIAIKDAIVQQVSNVKVNSLHSLTQVTSVIARATLEPSEVTVETQSLAFQTLSSLTSWWTNKMSEDNESEEVLMEEQGENLVLFLGNLLHSASQKVAGKTNETEVEQMQSKEVITESEKLINDVASALLSRMMVDQEPVQVRTKSISMVLNRLTPGSLGTSMDLSQAGASLKLSFNAITDEKARDAKFIDILVTTTNFNPYSWDPSSSLVSSHVVNVVIKNHKGETLRIKDSKEDIEINIPREVDLREEEEEDDQSRFIKPSREGKMQYHKIDVGEENALRVKIRPVQSASLQVFIRYGKRPTLTKYDTKQRINKDENEILLLDDVINRSGTYFIGILYDKIDKEEKRRKKRSCSDGGRQKRSCVEPKDPPRLNSIGRTIKPIYEPGSDLNYTIRGHEDKCLFWNTTAETWSSHGCKVGPRTNSTFLHCLCNHLTAFGGGVLVMPNTLDFDVAYTEMKRLDQTGNVAVLSAIIVVLLLYFLVVMFARRADKRDIPKTGPTFQLHSSQEALFQYNLTITTGIWKDSGTDANVAIVIHGSEAQSQPIILNKNMIKSRTVLARGNEDSFTINLPMSLGEVRYIHVWHDNSGNSPSWFLSRVIVTDHQTEEKWTFVNDRWFAVEKGDGKIDRILIPVSPRELNSFKYSLKSRQSKSFSDGHLWLSVVTKSPTSKFTRVQRATCCLCVLMAGMLANAMFYRNDKEPDPTIQVGPLTFSWRQLVIGVQSGLLITPVNFLIMYLFKKNFKKPDNKVHPTTTTTSKPSIEIVSGVVAGPCKGRRRELNCKKCPRRAACFAWLLSFLVVIVSGTITFYYSLQWGKDIANQWLSSMVLSFTEDLFVLQPTKIYLIMVLSACVFHRGEPEVIRHETNKEKDTASSESSKSDTQSTASDDLQNIRVDVPLEEELERARKYRKIEAKAFSFGRELGVFLFYLLLLMVVCYGNRNYHGFLIGKNLQDTFSNFPKACDFNNFWKFLEGQFPAGIYATEWYNNQKVKRQEFIDNKMSILLGMPRLRQLRIQKDSCTVPRQVQEIAKHCNDVYSLEKEDKTPLNLPGWIPINTSAQFTNASKLCPAPWRYTSPKDLQLIPSWGFFTVYDGGGYVADLGYSKDTAAPLISNLRQKGWIDQQTRAVLLEFTIYNPYTGYLSIVTYYYEMLPTGYGITFLRIDTVLLTSTETGLYRFYLICQFLYIMLVFVFFLQELYKVYRQRCAYFRNVWNLIQILQLVSSSLVVAFYVIKSKIILKRISMLKQNPFITVSFQDVTIWNEAENGILAAAIFIATLKLLRMIRFNPHVIMLLQSFRVSRGLLVSYSVLFVVIFIAYAQLGRLAFGSNVYRYSTFIRTLAGELLMSLGGDMQFRELQGVNRVLGPFFSFSFVSLMAFIFVNFFVAILDDSYSDAKENTDRESEEFELADFIMQQLGGMLGFGRKQSRFEDKEIEVTEKDSLITTERSPSPDIKSQQKSGELEKMTEASPEKIIPKRNKKSQKKKLKKKNKEWSNEEVPYESQANEEPILQKLDSLTTSIAKDAVREDVELLCLIWLLSDEESRDPSQATLEQQIETDKTSSASIEERLVPSQTTVQQREADEIFSASVERNRIQSQPSLTTMQQGEAEGTSNSSTSTISCISLSTYNTHEQSRPTQNEMEHESDDHSDSNNKSQPRGSMSCW